MKTNFEMAKEAGLRDSVNLEAFAALVRADEREACAKTCEAEAAFSGSNGKKDAAASNCAAAIRARKQA